jgi:hypothetical protein
MGIGLSYLVSQEKLSGSPVAASKKEEKYQLAVARK